MFSLLRNSIRFPRFPALKISKLTTLKQSQITPLKSTKFVPFNPRISCKLNLKSFSTNSYHQKTPPIIGYWYLLSGTLVFTIVLVGGLTRLTESGLSITEWNLIKGMKPPTSQIEWEVEFNKYKLSPEFIKYS